MYKIAVVVNENIPEQLDIFLKTFKKVNNDDDIVYTFIITSTKFIKQYSGCQHDLLVPYKNDHRLGFLNELDKILAEKFDLVVVAYDMILCRKSMIDWFKKLINYTDSKWEICGSAITPPMFPLSLCQDVDFSPFIPKEYVTIDSGFYILNPKTVFTDNAEFASQIISGDRYDLLDELVFNIRYNAKIVNQLICCNAVAYISDFSNVKNANMNLYYEPATDNACWYFLDEYYDNASDILKHDIRSFFKKAWPKKVIEKRAKELLLNQNIVVSKSESKEIHFIKL